MSKEARYEVPGIREKGVASPTGLSDFVGENALGF
jgi:hypothetical protein